MQDLNKIYFVYVYTPIKNDILDEEILNRMEDIFGVSVTEKPEELDKYFYCWTTSKKVLKKFLKYRDKSKFETKMYYISGEKLKEFKSRNYETKIEEDPVAVETVTSRVKGYESVNGIVTFHFILTRFERDAIYGTIEYFMDSVTDYISDHSVVVLSIVAKCANKELKKALYNSDILNTLAFVDFSHNGNQELLSDDNPFIWMLDEVYILFDQYGELFKF